MMQLERGTGGGGGGEGGLVLHRLHPESCCRYVRLALLMPLVFHRFFLRFVSFLRIKVSMLEVPLLTEDQCRVIAEATAETIAAPGFVPSFSLFDPATEVPVQDLPAEVRYSM